MTETSPVMNRAYRIDNAILRRRASRARDKGFTAVVIPYTGYGSTTWVRVLGRVLLSRDQQRPEVEPAGARGWRSFTSIPVQHAEVEVTVGDQTSTVTADGSGIVDVVVEGSLPPGWQRIELTVEGSAPVHSNVFIVADDIEFGVVSDIDDTVMVTALPRPMLAAWHTFVVNEHARATTPGMPVLYERLVNRYPGAPVIYLSTGAWNVAPTLTRFLSRNLYPPGALLLTDWGPTAQRWFRSGQEHKASNLERLSREFPKIKWLLIGDDGQHDPEIYGAFLRAHPDHVRAVCIRELSPGEAVLAGGSTGGKSPEGTAAAPWRLAPDGAALAEELEDVGVLEEATRQPEAQI
nr:phosphatase domain-containing protein [uncultured Friedmanniella sp.]